MDAHSYNAQTGIHIKTRMQLTDVYGLAVVAGMIYLIYRAISKTQGQKLGAQSQEELDAQIRLERGDYYKELFKAKEFVNKNTKSLEEFVVSHEMNFYDIHKLAQLNGIKVEMSQGWTNLVVNLIKELDQTGWNRKVGSIKEKYGELRFYAKTNRRDILEKYTEMSKTICEICGERGRLYEEGWMTTRCEEHYKS